MNLVHPSDDLRRRQFAFNAASRDQWDGFSEHRRRVSALLGAGRPCAGTRLCVLGAGNANDLDLPALRSAHREVHLVDIDAAALAAGASSQVVAPAPGLKLHGGCDVTAMLDAMSSWSPLTPVNSPATRAMREWPAHRVAGALPGPFDVVASTCLLSQIINTARHALGEHRQLAEVAAALRAGHVRLLAELTAPHGTAVLISDVASSTHLTSAATQAQFPSLAAVSTSGDHVYGLAPSWFNTAFASDPTVAPRVVSVRTTPPWLWRLHQRDYLVFATLCDLR